MIKQSSDILIGYTMRGLMKNINGKKGGMLSLIGGIVVIIVVVILLFKII